jgi:hypothetical protein
VLPRRLPVFGIALSVVVGFALWSLAVTATNDGIETVHSALRDDESDYFFVSQLSFNVGRFEVYYGDTLAAFIAATLVAIVAVPIWRIRRRRQSVLVCPHCLSTVPAAATVCAYCTRTLHSAS